MYRFIILNDGIVVNVGQVETIERMDVIAELYVGNRNRNQSSICNIFYGDGKNLSAMVWEKDAFGYADVATERVGSKSKIMAQFQHN